MDTELRAQFEKMYDSHSDAVFRYCLWKTSDRDVSLDISQETFMRFWDEISKNTKVKNDRALLYTIARRLVIDWYRKKKAVSLERMGGEEDDPFEIPDLRSAPIEVEIEAKRAIEGIQRLDKTYRQAVYLRFVEGLSPKDIAKILDVSVNVASVRITRGLQELREMISPRTTNSNE